MSRKRDEKGRFLPHNEIGKDTRFGKNNNANPLGRGAAKSLTPKQQLKVFMLEVPVPEPIKKMYRSMFGHDPENLLQAINGVTTREAMTNANMKAINAIYKGLGVFDPEPDDEQQKEGTGKPRKYVVNVIKTRKVDENNERTDE